MVKGLLALRLHFDIMGQVLPHDPKVQTQSKEPSNHELGHAVINTSFERDIRLNEIKVGARKGAPRTAFALPITRQPEHHKY